MGTQQILQGRVCEAAEEEKEKHFCVKKQDKKRKWGTPIKSETLGAKK